MKISKKIYNKLKIDEAKLACLEANGVDNWHGYGCLCQDFDVLFSLLFEI
jgi:hypothetical protein